MEQIQLALYQPDIPQNTGTLLRTTACLGIGMDIIEPCGFVFSDKQLRRSGMDYADFARVTRHNDFDAFAKMRLAGGASGGTTGRESQDGGRLVLLSTQGDVPYWDFAFCPGDVLLLGRESAGVPPSVHDRADARVIIPMVAGARSLNVAIAGAMVLGEALRQLR